MLSILGLVLNQLHVMAEGVYFKHLKIFNCCPIFLVIFIKIG